MYYYERAAKEGHRLAMYNLGLIYLNRNFSNNNDDPPDNLHLRQRGRALINNAAELGLAEVGKNKYKSSFFMINSLDNLPKEF